MSSPREKRDHGKATLDREKRDHGKATLEAAIRAVLDDVGLGDDQLKVTISGPGDFKTIRLSPDATLKQRVDATAGEEHDETSRPAPRALRVRRAGRRRSVENELAPEPELGRLAATIRAARGDAEITLPELAERSGVSLGFLSRVENGGSVPRREKFEGIVEVLAHDESHARQLRNVRNWQELVDRFGMEEGIAALAVALGDEQRHAGALLGALARLTPEQRTSLDQTLREVAAATAETAS